MITGFLYFLIILAREYENAFKVGCTEDYSNRMPQYGSHLGPHTFQSDIFEITYVPDEIKMMFKGEVKEHRLCEYAEKYIHYYLNYLNYNRVHSPTTKCLTEFFDPGEIIVDRTHIEDILKKVGIKYKYIGKYDKDNHLTEGINKSKKTKNKGSKVNRRNDYDVTEESRKKFISENQGNPLKFINNYILRGGPLRDIQRELWDKLNVDQELMNGIIQWPTGTGKRIAIIMIIIVLFLYYKSNSKPFKCVVAANRKDIFTGNAWGEYKMMEFIGMDVYEGSDGKLTNYMKELQEKDAFLLITTHQSLVKDEGDFSNKLNALNIDCLIYDETQNITSENMYRYLIKNKPKHLIGISATPYTDDESQNERLKELFKENFISKCSYKEAIEKGYINRCEFYIYGYDKNAKSINKIINIIDKQIRLRIDNDIWKRRKFIIWIPETNEEKEKYIDYIVNNTKWNVFRNISDEKFKQCNTTDTPWCLVLCQKGREGYDQKDIEFGVTIGNSSCHLYIQEQGRSQRIDYEGKISELLIFIEDDKINDVYNSICNYMDGDYIGEIKNINDVDTEDDVDTEEEIELEKVRRKELELEVLKNNINKNKENKKQHRIKERMEDKKQSKLNYKNKIKKDTFARESNVNKYNMAKKENKTLKIQDDDY